MTLVYKEFRTVQHPRNKRRCGAPGECRLDWRTRLTEGRVAAVNRNPHRVDTLLWRNAMFIPASISCSRRTRALKVLFVAAGFFFLSAGALAQTAVVMSQYEPGRTAANLDEHLLKPSNVGPATFGKLFSRSVDDSV